MSGVGEIVIGTRGSPLARAQAEQAARALKGAQPGLEVRLVPIQTRADRDSSTPLARMGAKGLFTAEIEQALREGRIDLAAHSLKDLPTLLPEGLAIGAVLERREPRDVLVSRAGRLAELPPGSSIGTSSVRRRAQLLAHSRGLRIVDMRGNVDTRVRKLTEGACTALVLAGAGLMRLGLAHLATEWLEPEVMVPAPGQGIIALESRVDDRRIAALLAEVNHGSTWTAALAERGFLRRLGGGCSVPAGCLAFVDAAGIRLTGLLADSDGRRVLRDSLNAAAGEAEAAGERLAALLLARGGAELLETVAGSGAP